MLLSDKIKPAAFFVLLLGVWWFPWWLFGLLWLSTLIFLPRFYPALIPALIFDLTYSAANIGPFGLALPFSITTAALLALMFESHYFLRL